MYNDFLDVQKKEKVEVTTTEGKALGKIIAEKIRTGVELEDGRIRPFDQVDLLEITEVPLSQIIGVTRRSSEEDCAVLEEFLHKNNAKKILRGKEIDDYLEKVNYRVNVKFDKSNRPISNTGRDFTMEEKIFVKDYLKSIEIPFTYDTYKSIRQRIARGYMEVETPKKFVK